MKVFENLKKIRTERGITQTFVAKKINISRQAYCNYESGARQPDYETLIKIANILETTPNNILGMTDEKSTQLSKDSLLPNEKSQPQPDIKWGDFGISFYEGGEKKLNQKGKDKIAKLVQAAVIDDDYYWGDEDDK